MNTFGQERNQVFRISITILLLVAFAASSFYKASMVLDYYTNTSTYSRNCENKDLPTLNCAGKCQLMKKFMAEQQKEKQNPEGSALQKTELLSHHSFLPDLRPDEYTNLLRFTTLRTSGCPVDRSWPVFHPPARI